MKGVHGSLVLFTPCVLTETQGLLYPKTGRCAGMSIGWSITAALSKRRLAVYQTLYRCMSASKHAFQGHLKISCCG
jgi:hypothetical protein